MSDRFRKVRPGEQLAISAEAWNAMLDAVRAHKERRHDRGPGPLDQVRDADIHLVRNDSGAPRGRFDVLEASGPLIGPAANLAEFQNRIAFSGGTPTTSDAFGILLEPLAEGAIGRAVWSGCTIARVYVSEEADEQGWTLAAAAVGQAEFLECVRCGPARILWREPDTGVRWAIIRIDGLGCECDCPGDGSGAPCDCQCDDGSGSGSGSGCTLRIGPCDPTRWRGYRAGVEQLLGHDAAGCWQWFDVSEEGDVILGLEGTSPGDQP